MIKGAIFDMDGVVVNNHEYHFEAWMELSRTYSFELDEKIYRDQYNGKTNAELFRMIFPGITEQKILDLIQEKEGLYQKRYEQHMRAHTGLVSYLDSLRARKIKIALGTSAPTMNVNFTLDKLDLRKYFSIIVDGPQVKRGKPDPEVYAICCERLGLDPKDCVVFEDSLAGLDSGKAAGCRIIGVATSHSREELISRTQEIIADFTEVDKFSGL